MKTFMAALAWRLDRRRSPSRVASALLPSRAQGGMAAAMLRGALAASVIPPAGLAALAILRTALAASTILPAGLAALAMLAIPGTAVAANWKISTEPVTKIRANYPADLRVTVIDTTGKPVIAASVELALNMIDMDHGEQRVAASMVAPGVYQGKVNFYMVGPWALDVRVSKSGEALTQKIRFDIKE